MADLLAFLVLGVLVIGVGVGLGAPGAMCFVLADRRERDWPGWVCDYLLPALGVTLLVIAYGGAYLLTA